MKILIPFFLLSGFILVLVFVSVDPRTENTRVATSEIEEQNNFNSPVVQSVEIAGEKIKVDLAVTSEEKQLGLSGRSELPPDRGMLFVFDSPDRHFFWMKDMNFAIDIIWLDEEAKVIYIKKDATPNSYPETFGPDQSAKYVLEVVSGFSEKNKVKVGDKVEFVY